MFFSIYLQLKNMYYLSFFLFNCGQKRTISKNRVKDTIFFSYFQFFSEKYCSKWLNSKKIGQKKQHRSAATKIGVSTCPKPERAPWIYCDLNSKRINRRPGSIPVGLTGDISHVEGRIGEVVSVHRHGVYIVCRCTTIRISCKSISQNLTLIIVRSVNLRDRLLIYFHNKRMISDCKMNVCYSEDTIHMVWWTANEPHGKDVS